MSNTTFRDQNTVTTILAIRNQLAANIGISLEVDPATTINTKRGVIPEWVPTTFPKIRYFGIGIKGYANLTSEDNIAQPYVPSPEDCDLYNPVPFRCVRVTEDLTDDEKAQYRIRTKAIINDVEYYQYWLKKIIFESTVAKTTKITDGVESEYTFTSANLSPSPVDLYPTDLGDTSNRIVASVTGICRVTGKEILEVCNAMYGGDIRRMRISEFGTYSGCEWGVNNKEMPVNPKDASCVRLEAGYVQLCTHKCTLGQTLSNPDDILIERKVFENGSCVIV